MVLKKKNLKIKNFILNMLKKTDFENKAYFFYK